MLLCANAKVEGRTFSTATFSSPSLISTTNYVQGQVGQVNEGEKSH